MAMPIMIQGTMSNVGKSIITSGLCRIFAQDGYSVAPFKSQNMALNSYITPDGAEIGRAQAVQAEACGILPSASMNPILLKPVTDMGSQVIIMGRALSNMKAYEYYEKKKDLIPVIKSAYSELSKKHDIIVIEGAGSPVEINLNENDIVNMGMAEMADSPVLLVGDIDRGGVFAQLKGTVDLLRPNERERVRGLIINKFRGDENILKPGLEMLEDICGKKVIGVVPYADIDIDEEDSLYKGFGEKGKDSAIDIAVIRLPKISNFTDFRALEAERDASVRYVKNLSELGSPDIIVLPGTKNTVSDLKWLRESGIETEIIKRANDGRPIIGICGGFQMLGRSVSDPFNTEGGGKIMGMGLLPVDTELAKEKITALVSDEAGVINGVFAPLSGKKITGYEIHSGRTQYGAVSQPFAKVSGGCVYNNILGTYIHGLFDEDDIRASLMDILYDMKGKKRAEGLHLSYKAHRNAQYDRLADILRASLDMQSIYDIIFKRI